MLINNFFRIGIALRRGIAIGALVTLFGVEGVEAQGVLPPPIYSSLTDFEKRTLLIMDPNVVADPTRTTNPCSQPSSLRVWSFGALMKEMASSDDVGAVNFIKHWLGQFLTDQTINGQTVAARDISKIWQGWQSAQWDINQAPFQLLAIVNRIDLLRSPLLAGESAGEVRFVFGGVNLGDSAHCSDGLNFTVILEYGARQSSCDDLQNWAAQWVSLAALTPTDPKYRDQLQQLTDTVTPRNTGPTKPNGSAIDRVRTNEGINPPVIGSWQMREFRLDPASKQLAQTTTTLTPMDSLNGTQALTDFLNSIATGLQAQDYWIPARFPMPPDDPLLGASSTAGISWSTHPLSFAQNTCSGCHGGTTTALTHIDPTIPHDISQYLADQVSQHRDPGLNALAKSGCSLPPSSLRFFKSLVH
jgi:hypothetical protein